jgi:3-hydroxyisobutyrate dehydrogenase-like beta-hydroxyacid dehydrogenase
VAAPFVHYRRESFERPENAPVMLRVALASKDLRLALALAGSVGAELPQAETNLRLLEETEAAGLLDADVSAVARYLREKEANRAPPGAVPERGG